MYILIELLYGINVLRGENRAQKSVQIKSFCKRCSNILKNFSALAKL